MNDNYTHTPYMITILIYHGTPSHLYYNITNVQSKFYNSITMVLRFVLKKKKVQKHSIAIKHVQKMWW